MKGIHLDPHRGYRERCASRDGEHGFQPVIGETDLRATTASSLPKGFKDTLAAYVHTLHGELEVQIALRPKFRYSFVPIPPFYSAPSLEIIWRMTEVLAIAGVGLFMAVAGAIVRMAVESLAGRSPDFTVEDRGDVFTYSRCDRVAGLLLDPESGVFIGLNVVASACPSAPCTPSVAIEHSLSLGQGGLVLVRSLDGVLASTLATALCSRLQGPGDIKAVVGYARCFTKYGLTGIFVQCGGAIGIQGGMGLTVVEQGS